MALSSDSLADFIRQKFNLHEDETLNHDTALFSSGLLDSFHLVELITFVETRAKIRIEPMEISLQNLDSIDKIMAFVDKKRMAAISV